MAFITISKKKRVSFTALLLCLIFFVAACARFSKQKPDEVPDLSQPRQSFYSSPLGRFNSGFMNIATGPFELIDQPRQEINRTNYLRGLIPGIFRGVTWLVVREAVGVFEIVTFPLPLKPHLEPINTDWLTL